MVIVMSDDDEERSRACFTKAYAAGAQAVKSGLSYPSCHVSTIAASESCSSVIQLLIVADLLAVADRAVNTPKCIISFIILAKHSIYSSL